MALTDTSSFDLVLLDLMMPGLSGFEVLCRLKAGKRTRDIPVVALSAIGTYRVRARSRDNDGRWSHWSTPVQLTAAK